MNYEIRNLTHEPPNTRGVYTEFIEAIYEIRTTNYAKQTQFNGMSNKRNLRPNKVLGKSAALRRPQKQTQSNPISNLCVQISCLRLKSLTICPDFVIFTQISGNLIQRDFSFFVKEVN
ncbi:MAG: hypothetical protein ACYTBV_12980, partial [Planctomycetota bacterium]